MNEQENVQEASQSTDSVEKVADTPTAEQAPKKLKRNNVKGDFKEKSDQAEQEAKPPMSREETMAFYNDVLPFLRLQDEYNELLYKDKERKTKSLELQVREIESIGYLSQWKAGQDDAKRRAEHEAKMKEEWEKMTPEEREEWTRKAQENLKHMEQQAKTGAGMGVVYDGTNAAQVLCFTEGVPFNADREVAFTNEETKQICFPIPDSQGGTAEVCMVPGQLIERLENGEFIISFQ